MSTTEPSFTTEREVVAALRRLSEDERTQGKWFWGQEFPLVLRPDERR